MHRDKNIIPKQYLSYDFRYEGQRHKGKILLDEDTPNLYYMYDDHNLEITWVKRIRHKGKYVELNIVINDDVYDVNEGKVAASAWVCVYALTDRRNVLEQFEPDYWSYTDEADSCNDINKSTFYNS